MPSNLLTLDQFKAALPKNNRRYVTTDQLDRINLALQDPALTDTYKDNLLMYSSVLTDGRFKLDTYIDAVRYVSCKVLGATNFAAWVNTFPDRYQHYMDTGLLQKHIESVVSAYNKGILVNKILEQTLIPTHIINQGTYQEAINRLAFLMNNAKSELVQSQSAAKLVEALRIPETQKIELDLGIKDTGHLKELRDTTMALVKQQQDMLEKGIMTPKEVAHSKLVIVEAEIVN